MKPITYAGDGLLTSDAVASLLIEIRACLARRGSAGAVRIPIVRDGRIAEAEPVMGVGNDVLVVPADVEFPEPDFSAAASAVRDQGQHRSGSLTVHNFDLPDFGAYLDDYPTK